MKTTSPQRRFDPSLIASIASEVVRRLREGEAPDSADPAPAAEKLITIETLDRHRGRSEVVASARAVITPAAREEAARRGIKIQTSAPTRPPSPAATGAPARPSTPTASDDAFARQLSVRGIVIPDGVEVIWTPTPAAEVFRRCAAGDRAVMITTLTDVPRFADELAPQVWVLDQEKLNLTAAVNVARQVARHAKSGRKPADAGAGGPR